MTLLLEIKTEVNDLAGRPIGTSLDKPLSESLSNKAETVEDFNNMNKALKNPEERMAKVC